MGLNHIPSGTKIRISQTYLEMRSGSSNKFYRTLVITNERLKGNPSTLIMNWGPIGKSGQFKNISNVSADLAYEESRKKIAEKTSKGYLKSSPSKESRSLGLPGFVNSHTFGDDALKDKEIYQKMLETVGSSALFNEVLEEIGAHGESRLTSEKSAEDYDHDLLLKEEKERKERERLEAIENARVSTYSTSWGDWA